MKKKCYVAGPMRGFLLYNFPAFDEARDRLQAQGFEVISPADMDRAHGFDPSVEITITRDKLREFVARDVKAILTCDVIAMLPGWGKSRGAKAEYALARWLGLDVIDAWTLKPIEETDHV
jgi:hypothetical protein